MCTFKSATRIFVDLYYVGVHCAFERLLLPEKENVHTPQSNSMPTGSGQIMHENLLCNVPFFLRSVYTGASLT